MAYSGGNCSECRIEMHEDGQGMASASEMPLTIRSRSASKTEQSMRKYLTRYSSHSFTVLTPQFDADSGCSKIDYPFTRRSFQVIKGTTRDIVLFRGESCICAENDPFH